MKISLFVQSTLLLLLAASPVQAQLASQQWGEVAGAHRIHAKAEHLDGLPLGPFVILPDGNLLTVEASEHATAALISADDGKTWQKVPIFKEPDKFNIRYERALICTHSGAVIVAFANMAEQANWKWDAKTHDSPDARLPTYAVRSPDGGQTWEAPQKLHDDWTGAIRDTIQLRDGTVVFTSMMMLHDPGRHAVVTYASKDEGKTWQRSNVIDLGGIGHHDGAIEATLAQRKDDSLWMLLRTNWGRQWQAVSTDNGAHWHPIGPTTIDSSTAPAILERLASGRLFLAWNRYYYAGTQDFRQYGGDYQSTGTVTSNNRQELSIAFSDDDGVTWTTPMIVATVLPENGKYPLKEVSYPYAFERRPGEIWLTTWRGAGLRVKLLEKDFVTAE
ncbi:MAG: exo-alpha-sialidase [Planctomycetes bacterium]|nr:exo-alpha-sialidase [Planctomycetota bacterium]